MKNWIKITIGLALTGCIAAFLLYYFVYNKPQPDFLHAEAAHVLEAGELYHRYTQEKTVADSLYTGEVVILHGALTRSETADSMCIAIFVFGTGMFGEEGIRCTLLPGFSEEILQVSPGDRVILKGYCTGYNDTDVILEHCSIIR